MRAKGPAAALARLRAWFCCVQHAGGTIAVDAGQLSGTSPG